MQETGCYDTKPEALNTLHLGVSFPAESFLTEREPSSAVEESQEGKSPSSIESHTYHTKECVREVSKYRSQESIIHNSFMTLSCLIEIYHVFDIFCESKAESDESNTIYVVWDTFCPHGSSQEKPQDYEPDETHTTDSGNNEAGIPRSHESINKSTNNENIDENNGHSQGFPDTEYEKREFREFLEKCEKEDDTTGSPVFWYTQGFERSTEIADKIIPFNIYLKKEEWEFFSSHVWVLNRPIKGEKNTSNDYNTCKEECEALS